jgi:hypothetical protein
MLGCDIDTKPNNGLFHGDLKTPLKKLVKFNKNISKSNQTYIGNKISKNKKKFLCRKIAKFRQKQNLLETKMWKSAHNVLVDEVIRNEEE